MTKILKIVFSCIFLLMFIQVVFAEKKPNKKKFVGYPITESDSLYIQNIRENFSNITNHHPEFHSYNIIAYHDQQAGEVNLLSDKYLEIKLDVLPIPYIGKYLKGLLSIDEYARFYNVWEDSLHIQEEKRGTYIYKIRPDSSFQLLKYYGNRKRRKHRQNRVYKGKDIISLLNSKLNGNL